MKLPVTIDPRYHDAVLFDLNGVLTDTASVHAAAWTVLFDDFLTRRSAHPGEDHSPFTDEDYRRFVDGKPRYAGVNDFLAARGISLPQGQEADTGQDSICGLGNRKQQLFVDLLSQGVRAFESTLVLVRKLQANGVATAVFSSSRNCELVLEAAGIDDVFAVRVDGVVAEELGLAGEPDPAVLLETARRLGVRPDRTVVIEDAHVGVTAGLSGGFALVIGVNRTEADGELLRYGADVVIHDLADVSLRTGDKRISELPNALDSYGQLVGITGVRDPLLFLDYDGTLSPIVSDPAAATLVEGVAEALIRQSAVSPIAILSGRDLADIRSRVDIPGIWYAGSHGFELTGPDGSYHQNEEAAAAVPLLERAADELRDTLAHIPGVRLEHRRFGVTIHYREVAADQMGEIVAATHRLAQRDGLRVANGRKVVELQPDVDWDSGAALHWIRARVDPAGSLLPMYIGDDLTDEEAFDAIRFGGVGIVVRHSEDGDRRSAAQFSLESPDQVGNSYNGVRCGLPTRTRWRTRLGSTPSTDTIRRARSFTRRCARWETATSRRAVPRLSRRPGRCITRGPMRPASSTASSTRLRVPRSTTKAW